MIMREIDLSTWPRRKHFEVYNSFDYPHFNLTANVDITPLYPLIKQHGISFTIAMVYILAKAANAIPEFHLRIRDGRVIEHEVVHPSPTILTEGELFSFCTIPFTHDFETFARAAAEKIEQVKNNPTLEDEPGQDDLLFMTSIPWVSFTSLMHPLHMHPVDSVPRIAWGKYFPDGDWLKLPLSVEVHHALMDGVHVGHYYELVQEYLNRPDRLLSVRIPV